MNLYGALREGLESGEEMTKQDFLKLKHDFTQVSRTVTVLSRAIILLITVVVLLIVWNLSGNAGAAYHDQVSQSEIQSSSDFDAAKATGPKGPSKKKEGSMSNPVRTKTTKTPKPQKCNTSVEIDNKTTCLSDLVLPLAACPTAVDVVVGVGNGSYAVSVCTGDLTVRLADLFLTLNSEVSVGFQYLYSLILNISTPNPPAPQNTVFPKSDATNNDLLQSFQCPFCANTGFYLPPTTDSAFGRNVYLIRQFITPALKIYYTMELTSTISCLSPPAPGRRRNMAQTDLLACSQCYAFTPTPYGYMALGYNESAPAAPLPEGLYAKWNIPVDIIIPYWIPLNLSNSSQGGNRQAQCPSRYMSPQDDNHDVSFYRKSTFLDFLNSDGVKYNGQGEDGMCAILGATGVATMSWRNCYGFILGPV
eukprot:g68558.t1